MGFGRFGTLGLRQKTKLRGRDSHEVLVLRVNFCDGGSNKSSVITTIQAGISAMTRSQRMDRSAIRRRIPRARFTAAAAILCAGLSWAAPSAAQDTPAFPDFTFKRVKPPEPGSTGRRITVQIEPQPVAVARPAAPVDAAPDAGGDIGRYSWFWETISPLLDDSGPGRLEPALIHIANAGSGQQIAAPRLTDLLGIARLHRAELLLNTVGTRVSPALVLAVIAVESSGRADAVSSAGAVGLMQLIPATADRFGVADSLNAGQNIKGGVAYLDWLLKEFGDSPVAPSRIEP